MNRENALLFKINKFVDDEILYLFILVFSPIWFTALFCGLRIPVPLILL